MKKKAMASTQYKKVNSPSNRFADFFLIFSLIWWFQTQSFTSQVDGKLKGPPELPRGTLESSTLEPFKSKAKMIKKTYRPPNYETLVSDLVMRSSSSPSSPPVTANDRFFVRYHHPNIPKLDSSWFEL